ncbi:DivIVA domain-containing protein [Prescottella agglutinans]|uniref:DivIVA domain-containing protein n=1 Tax=Prescottella agglutinans TaxID=1644129 RepID=UPI003D9679E5
MLTVLLYLVIMALVGGLLYLAASAVFGRSEELPPLPAGTTATVLPAEGVSGADVRALRFQQTLRGYKASEVDWALDRLGREIDSLRAQLAERVDVPASDGPDDSAGPDEAEAGR